MARRYEVTGYDRETGNLAVSYDVPERKIAIIKKIAGIALSDDGLGSYPLGSGRLLKIARALKTDIDQGRRDFFLEPYEERR